MLDEKLLIDKMLKAEGLGEKMVSFIEKYHLDLDRCKEALDNKGEYVVFKNGFVLSRYSEGHYVLASAPGMCDMTVRLEFTDDNVDDRDKYTYFSSSWREGEGFIQICGESPFFREDGTVVLNEYNLDSVNQYHQLVGENYVVVDSSEMENFAIFPDNMYQLDDIAAVVGFVSERIEKVRQKSSSK